MSKSSPDSRLYASKNEFRRAAVSEGFIEAPALVKRRPVWPAAWKSAAVYRFARLLGVSIEIRYTRLT